VYIPPGVAHGFASLTDLTLTYLVDGYYDPSDELGVAWDDPDIGADWGVTDPILSARDAALPPRREVSVRLG
jgi:dTDP-4-dehydrorhamnose 3,5-epimerase